MAATVAIGDDRCHRGGTRSRPDGGAALGAPGAIEDGWHTFKQPASPQGNETSDRFISASGTGRYQYWAAAVDANARDPLIGIGPGTYEYWWAREGTIPGFVRDAHSLYLETLAELGIVGLLLIGGFIVAVLVAAARKATRGSPESRGLVAAAAAGCAAFATAAAIDWVWEVAVLPVAFLLLAAAVLAHGEAEQAAAPPHPIPEQRGAWDRCRPRAGSPCPPSLWSRWR